MFGYLNHSLLLRAGLAMGLVTVLAIGGMASAIFVTRSTHGETAAVNQAGSLRMQSYHIAAVLESEHKGGAGPFGDMNLLTAEFKQRLTNPRLTDVVNTTSRKSIQEVYQLIMGRWQGTILPLLHDYMEQKNDSFMEESFNKTRLAFRGIVGGFVADIDNLVRLLEEDAESRIHMLGLFQGISLFLTLAVAIATLYLLQIDVLGPLHELLNAAEQAGNGNFTARVSHTELDELGRLGRPFNTMATDLSKIYEALEERVAEKTRKLTQRNQSLELLYTATQYLAETPVSEQTYRKLLNNIGQVVEIDGITLCTMDERKKRAHRIGCNGPIPPMCKSENCGLCLGDGITQLLGNMEHGGAQNILSVPVGDKNNNNGVLLVETKPDKELKSWQIQLLETLGKHIGISVDVTRRVTQRHRLALLEERSVMARELHDSLAQSLTYLKIQVTRLSVITRSGAERSAVEDALRELKEGLESASRQLRELLTTFRLQMDGSGLGPALVKTVEEFNARGNLDIQLNNQLKTSQFTVNEEIHVLQIVREALSNVIHHSKATQARVNLSFGDDNGILVSVEDNGIGLPQKAKRTHHYGLAIMHERSKTLHGNLRIERQDHGGTKVSLRFQPAATQKQFSSQEEETT
ncbi:MAG: type IV pili methyl-accepting chemotaxis transducer N-terminal domain-containing protein [Candidatus Thiodiazotropha sp. (ex Lucinoma aequizonata)]|nr:type IV pili methyl-accepting chemotaxis transducer N-terminal domain-containing protein [Candidatus Thiodiazotropha sp. (ex Lucinoma aequizonata)]MCU7886952.1 type IV pili methyl-accepting chemotaxis transducer N-terminal domain-containing protein [Candidatus Thiodiazotropha sp. (ex Lucinoma aequizonata)]MCU7896776.1 type IV pili methyl-accepting chemotaxis transducer N-terminal domain-containing protein [Candidatus Thiodiazotropha sp. (ex Lucinoma aequizonata)]MCU7897982.1 type IV pili meth